MSTPYHIRISPRANKQILSLTQRHQKDIVRLIEALAINPRPPGTKKIEGMTGLYCEEVNDMRLIYKVEDNEILVLLVN